MKKSIFFAAVAALFALASCQVDIVPVEEIAVNPVFTAEIVTTRTTIELVDASKAKVSWVEGDEVKITDTSNNITATYKATEVNGGSAKLIYKSGPTLGAGPYTAVYGSAPSTSQTYSIQIPSLPMSAESANSENTLNFSVSCGLLELNLTKPGESIKSIAVSNGSDTYTLTCTTPVSIAAGNTFYIALPAGDYTSFTFKSADDVDCTKTLKSDKTFNIPVNTIYAINFGASSLNFGTSYPEGTLSGEFSVSASKKVRFSRGNLQYQAKDDNNISHWRFAANQYVIIGDKAGNNTDAESRASQSDWIDLFGWGATGRTDLNGYLKKPEETVATEMQYKTIGTAASDEVLTRDNGGDWGICVGDYWRLLTDSEWEYLLGSSEDKRNNAASLCAASTVEIVPGTSAYGLLIMPDGWSNGKLTGTTDFARWKTLENAGGVFLPAAGRRTETTIYNYPGCGGDVYGYYWSSTAVSQKNANSMIILPVGRGFSAKAQNGSPRHYGASVRLVIDVANL